MTPVSKGHVHGRRFTLPRTPAVLTGRVHPRTVLQQPVNTCGVYGAPLLTKSATWQCFFNTARQQECSVHGHLFTLHYLHYPWTQPVKTSREHG